MVGGAVVGSPPAMQNVRGSIATNPQSHWVVPKSQLEGVLGLQRPRPTVFRGISAIPYEFFLKSFAISQLELEYWN